MPTTIGVCKQSPILSATKMLTSGTLDDGNTLEYTVTVYNQGDTAATGVTASDSLTGITVTSDPNNLFGAGATIAAGGSVVATYEYTAGNADLPILSNTVTVTSNEGQTVMAREATASSSLPVSPGSLAITKTVTGDTQDYGPDVVNTSFGFPQGFQGEIVGLDPSSNYGPTPVMTVTSVKLANNNAEPHLDAVFLYSDNTGTNQVALSLLTSATNNSAGAVDGCNFGPPGSDYAFCFPNATIGTQVYEWVLDTPITVTSPTQMLAVQLRNGVKYDTAGTGGAGFTTMSSGAGNLASPPPGTNLFGGPPIIPNADRRIALQFCGPAGAGTMLTYNFSVQNDGTVPLENIVIDDPRIGVSGLALTPSNLGVGATGTASASYTVSVPDTVAGSITNTATATGQDSSGFFAMDTDTITTNVG